MAMLYLAVLLVLLTAAESKVSFLVRYPEVVVNGSVYYKAHAANGELLTTNQTAHRPYVGVKGVDETKLYTLMTTDPDAPTPQRPTSAEIVHWLAINLLGADDSIGDVLQPYRGPGPPAGSPPHRYIFRLFEQPGRLDRNAPQTNLTSRTGFNSSAWIMNNKLTLVAQTHLLAQRNG